MRRVRLPCGKDQLASSCRRLYVGIERWAHRTAVRPRRLAREEKGDQHSAACLAGAGSLSTTQRRAWKLLGSSGRFALLMKIEMAVAAVAMGGHGGAAFAREDVGGSAGARSPIASIRLRIHLVGRAEIAHFWHGSLIRPGGLASIPTVERSELDARATQSFRPLR